MVAPDGPHSSVERGLKIKDKYQSLLNEHAKREELTPPKRFNPATYVPQSAAAGSTSANPSKSSPAPVKVTATPIIRKPDVKRTTGSVAGAWPTVKAGLDRAKMPQTDETCGKVKGKYEYDGPGPSGSKLPGKGILKKSR